jgi:pyruvate kinase
MYLLNEFIIHMVKKTKIISTIGPATFDFDMLKKLAETGTNIARFNFSHADYDNSSKIFKQIREAKLPLAIMLDTKGPEIRTGEVEGAIEVKNGDKIILTIEKGVMKSLNDKLSVNYDNFITDAKIGTIMSVDSGAFLLEVEKVSGKDVYTKIIKGNGKLTTKRHINFTTGEDTSQPTLGEKDYKDVDYAAKENCDFIAFSFVRSAKDVNELREYCKKKNYFPSIISKIENQAGVDNLDEIVQVSDGIMVARGDLSEEVPFYKVPQIQREAVQLCKLYEKSVVIATQMILSMCDNIRPTRAEVNDVATAAFQGADCTMTSDETAKGKYPIESIETMSKIISYNEPQIEEGIETSDEDIKKEVAKGAVEALGNISGVQAIVVLSKGGKIVAGISSVYSALPIYAFTENEHNANKLRIQYGVQPDAITFESDYEKTITNALDKVKSKDKSIKRALVISYSLVNGKEEQLISVRSL